MTAVIAPSKVERLQQVFALTQTRDTNSDEVFVLNNVSWEQFNELLELLPDQRGTLLRYLEGELEIMAPGRNHEQVKKILGILLECYFFEREIDFFPLGSTTFRHPLSQKGIEPDECYCFQPNQEYPDLAIEVIFTSGGLDLLEIYRAMNVREVWFWKKETLSFFRLEEDSYREVNDSIFLPDLQKSVLEELLISTGSPIEIRKIFQQKIRIN